MKSKYKVHIVTREERTVESTEELNQLRAERADAEIVIVEARHWDVQNPPYA